MTSPLERVIAEQQAEIDRLKSLEKSNLNSWIRQNKHDEEFMHAFWLFYNNPEEKMYKRYMHETLIRQGYCLNCQQKICECDNEQT